MHLIFGTLVESPGKVISYRHSKAYTNFYGYNNEKVRWGNNKDNGSLFNVMILICALHKVYFDPANNSINFSMNFFFDRNEQIDLLFYLHGTAPLL